jgi:hypothetical protein
VFKWIYLYWTNPTDTPFILSKLNLWTYINIKLFKIKTSQVISFFITNALALKQKYIKIFHKNFIFENFYKNSLIYNIFIIIFIIILL